MQNAALTDKQRQFAEDNHRLIYSFLQRYKFSLDDQYGVAAIGFCKAVRDFDPNRNVAFSTFAYRVMLNGVLRELRKARNPKRKAVVVSLQSETRGGYALEDAPPLEARSAEESSRAAVMEFIRTMKDEQRVIIASLAEGKTQSEIAGKIGVSQPQVSRYVKAIRVKFRNEFLSGEGAVHV